MKATFEKKNFCGIGDFMFFLEASSPEASSWALQVNTVGRYTETPIVIRKERLPGYSSVDARFARSYPKGKISKSPVPEVALIQLD